MHSSESALHIESVQTQSEMSGDADSELSLEDQDEELPDITRQLAKLSLENQRLIAEIQKRNSAYATKGGEAGFAAYNASISLQKQLDFQKAKNQQLSYHLSVLLREKAQLAQAVAKMPQKELFEVAALYEAKAPAEDLAKLNQKIAELELILRARRYVLWDLERETEAINGYLASEIGYTANKRYRCEDLVMLHDRIAYAHKPPRVRRPVKCADDSEVPLLHKKLAGLTSGLQALDLAAEQLYQRIADLGRCNDYLVRMNRKACDTADFDANLLVRLLYHSGKQSFMSVYEVSQHLPGIRGESALLAELFYGFAQDDGSTGQAGSEVVKKALAAVAELYVKAAKAGTYLAEWLGRANTQATSRFDSAAAFLADSARTFDAFSHALYAAAGKPGQGMTPCEVDSAEDQRIMDIMCSIPEFTRGH